MSKNGVIVYVCLVVLPVFGLVVILRSGQNLKASHSVDGVWTFQVAATAKTMPSCMSALGLNLDTPVTISQSGKNFAITAGETGGTGLIEETTLQAALRPVGTPLVAKCGGDGPVLLTATLDPAANPRVLSGVLSLAGCPSCKPVKFYAVKQASTPKKGVQ